MTGLEVELNLVDRELSPTPAGARILEVPGMGHDLPTELVDTIADAIAGHAGQEASASS